MKCTNVYSYTREWRFPGISVYFFQQHDQLKMKTGIGARSNSHSFPWDCSLRPLLFRRSWESSSSLRATKTGSRWWGIGNGNTSRPIPWRLRPPTGTENIWRFAVNIVGHNFDTVSLCFALYILNFLERSLVRFWLFIDTFWLLLFWI